MSGGAKVHGRAAAAFIAAAVLAAAPAGADGRRIQVEGRLTDPDGNGLAGQAVRLFKTQRGFAVERFAAGGKIGEAARAETDANGYYRIDIPRDRSFDDFYLRFYDPQSFDQVRFLLPADREITRDLKRGEPLRVDVAFRWHPQWAEVERRLGAAGEDSPQGRVLRALGIPEREGLGEGPDGPREEWWYYSHGVVYFFRDGRAAGFRRFDPVAAASSPGGGAP